jgi:hypothetical protein
LEEKSHPSRVFPDLSGGSTSIAPDEPGEHAIHTKPNPSPFGNPMLMPYRAINKSTIPFFSIDINALTGN